MDFTWITNDIGDITEVNTTAPLTGGGTSGALTLAVSAGSTSAAGVLQITDSTSSTSTTTAASPNSVKTSYDLANAAVPKSLADAKGDIFTATADNTPARLAVGTNGQILKANSATATGLEWAAAASSSPTSAGASVLTKQTTTSASFTDLTTAGPAVTLTTGTKALVLWSHVVDNATDGRGTYVSFAVSGSTTLAASSDYQTDLTGSSANRPYVTNSRQVLLTGLTAGSNTFTLKYATESSSTGSFSKRYITVIDMGS